jgi:hypothetical protein
LEGLPLELLEEVTPNLDRISVGNLRGASKRLDAMLLKPFFRKLVENRTVYATFASIAHFLGMLQVFMARALHLEVKDLVLVADGAKVPEYGYDWAWENLLQWDTEDLECTQEDLTTIWDINKQHASFYKVNSAWINSGGYRSMLIAIMNSCPNLTTIEVRKLKVSLHPSTHHSRTGFGLLTNLLQPDEHIPGWIDSAKFEKLSFHQAGINTKPIFYGDWQYDAVHHRVTHYTDEFGDDVVEPNAGPQASFIDDFNAAVTAVTATGRVIDVNFIRG